MLSNFSIYVDLAGSLSKLAPALVHMGSLHRTIRARTARPNHSVGRPVHDRNDPGSHGTSYTP